MQEDKISYVLAGKNLLSDASAGNVVTATPEVLGTQIARVEKYGISFNAESYVQWGYDRYFTDAKRGAVIQLKGNSGQSDQLTVVSEQSMRTWFRDMFNESLNTQKLGGFDPYMNEYVLSSNEELLPINPQCISCGISQTFTLSILEEEVKEETYCVDFGPLVGQTEISWIVSSVEPVSDAFRITIDYNGTQTSSAWTSEDGSLSFNKDSISEETAIITIEYKNDVTLSVLADCSVSETINIVEVVVTNNSEADKTIHTQYRYQDGTFIGPLLSNLVVFGSGSRTPIVSRYNVTSGFAGSGGFPPELSTMRLSTNKIFPDDYDFNVVQDKFKYLRTNVLYDNNDEDIQDLLAASIQATPNLGASPLFFADFTVPANTNGNYLYLIWDLRDAILTELCFGLNKEDACCDCTEGNYYLNADFENATSIFTNANMTTYASNGFYSYEGIVRQLVDGVLLPSQICETCSFEISLCFGTDPNDACSCDAVSYSIDLCYDETDVALACDCGEIPSCPDRRVVFQICNSNSVTDDNFDIYLNDTYIGAVDLSDNAQVGSVFIADLNTAVELASSDFVCPLSGMVTYHFDPSILQASNVLEMRNTQNNGSGNFGVIGVRNYSLSGTDLSDPCVITNLEYEGASGESFTFNFDYTQCCAD